MLYVDYAAVATADASLFNVTTIKLRLSMKRIWTSTALAPAKVVYDDEGYVSAIYVPPSLFMQSWMKLMPKMVFCA